MARSKYTKTITFRIISVNVRGVANSTKRRAIFDQHRKNADVLILLESHGTKETDLIWRNEWGGKLFASHGTSAARGVTMLVTNCMEDSIRNIYCAENGRVVIVDIEQDGQGVSLAAIYAPNEDSPNFFVELKKLMENRLEKKIIIGDFNLTLDVDLDRLNTYSNNNKSKEEVESMMDEFMLKDMWRIRNETKREYSWRKSGNLNKASRIDLALVSAGLDQQVEMIQYLSTIKTDHRAIYMVVDLNGVERGAGYWKFNNSLLSNIEFVGTMNREIQLCLDDMSQDKPILIWEQLKSRIKKTAVEFSKRSVSENKLVIAQLSEMVNEYESNLPLTKEDDQLLQQTKIDLEEKLMERARGIMFRSKVKWTEEGEKNTKYFFSLEKARYNAKTCYKLLQEDGTEITDPAQILEAQMEFYKQLYSEDQGVRFQLENHHNIFVPEEIKQEQNQQITLKELETAIKTMNNNKTPGEDGIPVDFYKVFWRLLQIPFYNMVLQVYQEEKLHSSARKGILNLIPKANKDTRLIKNLRPITLLNTDYKIIEKAVANKMIPALSKIIHPDQRGFMKERRISVNIRKMLDIIHQAESEDIEAIILSLDFVKCFDKCSFSILHGSLDYFGFGSIVKDWTHILYKDFSVQVQDNGYFSNKINILKGVHQGGCCSSVYFLVIAEILALSLRANQNIEGIEWKEIKNLLNQFADDMDIFSLATEKSIKTIYEELDKFKLHSGFTVSKEKTTMYRIGSLRHSDAQMYDMTQYTWSNKDINVLGVTIAHEDILNKNYTELITKAKQTLQSWKHRGLTLIGKIQVVNTLVASLFVYKMLVLPTIPLQVIRSFDNIVREFIWNKRKSKIAYNILQLPKKEGGLALTNLKQKDQALKATWPFILASEEQYSQMVYDILRVSSLKEDLWKCTLAKEHVQHRKIRNQFWENVLTSWCEFNFTHQFRVENQLIWLNSYIQVNNKPIMWNDIYNRGLKYVYELFENGSFKSEQQVRQQYGLTVLRFNSLKTAIPDKWKKYFYEHQ